MPEIKNNYGNDKKDKNTDCQRFRSSATFHSE